MPRETKPQLQDLAGVCRRLQEARRRVADLEAARDALIRQLREQGMAGAELAERTGLSPGRVAQISNNHH